MIVLGDKEGEDKVGALRDRKGGNHGVMSVEDMLAKFHEEIDSKYHD
jgi:threonyl-tRNA synthetase